MSAGIHRQGDGSDHERHRGPRGGPGKGAGRSSRAERGLASLSAESRGNVAALAALQQYDHDDEETDQDVNSGGDVNHKFRFFLSSTAQRADLTRFVRIFGGKSQVYGAEGGI